MPAEKQISNPGGVYGLTADPNNQILIEMVNNSGGTLIEGDLLVCTDVNGINATTTTTANDLNVIGAVGPGQSAPPALGTSGGMGAIGAPVAAAANTNTYAAGAVIPVLVYGAGRLNIGANAVASAGLAMTSFTSAKQAQTIAAAVGQIGAVVGTSKEAAAAKDASNTIRIWFKTG